MLVAIVAVNLLFVIIKKSQIFFSFSLNFKVIIAIIIALKTTEIYFTSNFFIEYFFFQLIIVSLNLNCYYLKFFIVFLKHHHSLIIHFIFVCNFI